MIALRTRHSKPIWVSSTRSWGEYNRAYEALRQVPVDKLPDEARLSPSCGQATASALASITSR